MIGRLKGTLIEKSPPSLVLDVQGVGYEIDAPMSTHYALAAVGKSVELYTHLLVREDAQLLYGFGTKLERTLFRALLKVSGIGAKVALSILSGMSCDEFLSCVARKDAAALTRIPGIGKKTADRLLLDLQDRVADFNATGVAAAAHSTDLSDPRAQATDALMALGYKSAEASRLLDKSSVDGHTVEEMIRAALKSANP